MHTNLHLYGNVVQLKAILVKIQIENKSLNFSTDNFKRDDKEVNHLMDLFFTFFTKDKKYFQENDIKVVFSGTDYPLPPKVIKARENITKLTANNKSGILNICLNYSGKLEIVDATKKIIKDKVKLDDITEELFTKYLYQDLPNVDLMIRTSGEERLSNFLPWQLAYSEFIFSKCYWPDFNKKELYLAIKEYQSRNRRFGGLENKNVK